MSYDDDKSVAFFILGVIITLICIIVALGIRNNINQTACDQACDPQKYAACDNGFVLCKMQDGGLEVRKVK